MQTRVLLLSTIAVILTGCGGTQTPDGQSYTDRAEAAFAEAEEALDDGNYPLALGLFRAVEDDFHLSPYAISAQLRVADTYFEQGEYRAAAEAYRQFIELHPSHGAVPYASFRIGMSHYEDMPSDFFLLPPPYQRDLTSTRLAYDALDRFLSEYEQSDDASLAEYLEEARSAHGETASRLVGYDFYVAAFYLDRQRPLAAIDHLRTLLRDFPDAPEAPEALFLLARSLIEVSDVEQALSTLDELDVRFPDHDLTAEGRAWRERFGL